MSETEKKSKTPLSLRRKSSARLAAVQCLYRRRMGDTALSADRLCEEYLAQWKEDRDSPNRAMSYDAEPAHSLLKSLVEGVITHEEEVKALLAPQLRQDWKLERMGAVLVALLYCATYELRLLTPSRAPAILLQEYVSLAARFFDPPEVGFVNGVLSAIAKTV